LLTGVVLTVAIAAPANAATPFDVGQGKFPDVAAAPDGGAHIVFEQVPAGQNNDVIHYCHVPRGATACDRTASFTTSAALPGDITGGENQTWILNPSGGTVWIVTHRSSIIDPTLNGAYVITSGNGGQSWNPPAKVGVNETRGGVVVGSSTGAFSTVTETGGNTVFQRMQLGGGSGANTASFSPSQIINGLPTLAVPPDGRSMFAWSQGTTDERIAWRRFKASPPSAMGPNYEVNWDDPGSAEFGIVPKMAAGPAGTVILFIAKGDRAVRSIRFDPAAGGGIGAFSPPEGTLTVSPPGSISEDDLDANSTSGHFHGVWKFAGSDPTELRYARSNDGTSWTAPVPILRGVGSADYFHVAGAADDSGWVTFQNGAGGVAAAPLEAIVDTPPAGAGGGGNPNPSPTPNVPTVAPSSQLSQVTVGNEVITLFGPASCVTPGQKVKLAVSSKRKQKLAGNKGRSKIKQATFFVDKIKKKDKKKAFTKSFSTDAFARGSVHKLGANLKLKQLSGKKRNYNKNLKGSMTMCS
jgi:hypothetical protein